MKLIIIMLLVTAAYSQTAKVIPLDSQDTQTIKALHTQIANLQTQLGEATEKIKEKYLESPKFNGDATNRRVGEENQSFTWVTTGTTSLYLTQGRETDQQIQDRLDNSIKLEKEQKAYQDAHPMIYFKYGWGQGEFEFTDDYKYIVPLIKPITCDGSSQLHVAY